MWTAPRHPVRRNKRHPLPCFCTTDHTICPTDFVNTFLRAPPLPVSPVYGQDVRPAWIYASADAAHGSRGTRAFPASVYIYIYTYATPVALVALSGRVNYLPTTTSDISSIVSCSDGVCMQIDEVTSYVTWSGSRRANRDSMVWEDLRVLRTTTTHQQQRNPTRSDRPRPVRSLALPAPALHTSLTGRGRAQGYLPTTNANARVTGPPAYSLAASPLAPTSTCLRSRYGAGWLSPRASLLIVPRYGLTTGEREVIRWTDRGPSVGGLVR